MIRVRDRDVLVERKRLLALGNHLSLEINDSRIQEKAGLLTTGLDLSTQTLELEAVAGKLERQDEILRIINVGWDIFELKFEGTNGSSDAECDVALRVFVVDLLVTSLLSFVQRINVIKIHLLNIVILKLLMDGYHNLTVNVVIRVDFRQEDFELRVLSYV